MLNKIVFLDRDGVININPLSGDYVKKWKEFVFLPRAKEALSLLAGNGCQIFLITNQAGVGRGLMTADDLTEIHQNLIKELAQDRVSIKGIYCCLHDRNAGCSCRKPKPGLLVQAANDYQINLAEAVFIGDSETDKLAAKAAGCKFIMVDAQNDLLDAVNFYLSGS